MDMIEMMCSESFAPNSKPYPKLMQVQNPAIERASLGFAHDQPFALDRSGPESDSLGVRFTRDLHA
jgi:hypothetical protein